MMIHLLLVDEERMSYHRFRNVSARDVRHSDSRKWFVAELKGEVERVLGEWREREATGQLELHVVDREDDTFETVTGLETLAWEDQARVDALCNEIGDKVASAERDYGSEDAY